jgi:RIO-like serine/threonine protein kinase
MIIEIYGGLEIDKLKLLGKGTQGKVYRVDSLKCIKIFKSSSDCQDEFETLFMAQSDHHFPRLYFAGRNYIIRECINGIELNKYLSQYPLTASISKKLLDLWDAMAKVGFMRLDSAIFHIFITSDGDLKLIDTAKSVKKKTLYPGLILKGLGQLGYDKQFLDYVKEKRPALSQLWAKSS